MTRNITFTDEEIQETIGLIDLAIRANGLQVANNGLLIAHKLKTALQTPPQELKAVEAA